MDEVKLLSSAAVLRALYDEKKDIYDALSEIIKETISTRSLSAFNSIDCVRHIEEDFGFCIPEAVVRTCLRKRLVQRNFLTLKNSIYTVTQSFDFSHDTKSDFDTSRNEYEEIINRLYNFCSDNGLLDVNKKELEEGIETYLTRPDKSNKHANEIAKFIVTYENEVGFKEKLNKIEEGLILYAGIRYSPDLSTLGNWRGDLIIFLDAEHLFNAAGLNGTLYKTLFNDLYELINEVNRGKKSGNITLKYLDETESDIDAFFYAAEKIVERKGSIDPSKTAMINICNGCKYKSDVVSKKAEFLTKLSKLKITKEKREDYYSKPEFNVESAEVIKNLSAELNESNVEISQISSILKIFTKVNYLREGKSNAAIDKVSAIFLTESWLPQRISFSDHVFEGSGAIPFATNIEFMTEKLWFKLNKGFGGKSKKPVSFDPIIRAKLTLSTQMGRSVSGIFKSLSEQYKNGLIDDEVVARIHHEIYSAPSKPDDVSAESIPMIQDFLDEDYIEKAVKEISLLEREASEGRKAIERLREIEYKQRQNTIDPLKKTARRQYRLLRIITYIISPILLMTFLINAYTNSDTALSVLFGIAGLTSLIITIFRPKKIDAFYWKFIKQLYRKSINKSLQRSE